VKIRHFGQSRTPKQWAALGYAKVTGPEFALRMSTGRWKSWEALTTPAKYPKLKRRQNPHKRHSAFRGITWDSSKDRWKARVWVNGKDYYLGRFEDELLAAAAYNEGARQAFGREAQLNDLEAG
jgi:hypothetical protein